MKRAISVSAAAPAVTPGESGTPSVAAPGTGGHQEHVGVAVVGAGELDDRRSVRRRARHAHRAHRRFGAGDDEAHHLAARHASGDAFSELDLFRRGEAEQHAVRQRVGQGLLDLRIRMAEQGRSPGADPVDEPPAGRVEHVRAARFDDRQRRRAHRLEGAHR